MGASEDDAEMIGRSQVVEELCAEVCLMYKHKGVTAGILAGDWHLWIVLRWGKA